MLSKRYESTEVDHGTWQHVPSGTLWSTSSDTHQVVEEKKEEIWLSPMTNAHTLKEKSKSNVTT